MQNRHKDQPAYKFAQFIFKIWKKEPCLISKTELIEILKSLEIDLELKLDEDVRQFLLDLMKSVNEQPFNNIELVHCPTEMKMSLSSY